MKVRYRLRDNGEPQASGYIAIDSINNKPDKGQFWSDRLIYLVLDMAQNIVFNQAIQAKDEVLLSGLFSGMSGSGVMAVPQDFGWYIGGTVYPPSGYDEKMARIYIGGESEAYRTVSHYAIYLVGETVVARWLTNYPVPFQLSYWRRPTPISGTNLNLTDFEDSVYTDIIVTQATVMLGMMEIQTGREYKNYTLVKQRFLINPKKFVNYIENREQIGQDYGSKERQKPDNDNGRNA